MSVEDMVDRLHVRNHERNAEFDARYNRRLAKHLTYLKTLSPVDLKPCPVCNETTHKKLDICIECSRAKHVEKRALRQQYMENCIRKRYSKP